MLLLSVLVVTVNIVILAVNGTVFVLIGRRLLLY